MCFDRTTKIAVVFKKSEVAVIFIKERLFFFEIICWNTRATYVRASFFPPIFGFWRHASSPGLSEMARKIPRFSTPASRF